VWEELRHSGGKNYTNTIELSLPVPACRLKYKHSAQSRIHGVKFARFSGRVDATEAGSDRVSNKSVRAENVVVKNKTKRR